MAAASSYASEAMVKTSPMHPEGPRYGAALVFLPGLWAGADVWRRAASYFAHRGWEGTLVELRDVAGGVDARVRAVVDVVRRLPAAPVLVVHDAGALVALAVARECPVRALVLVAPLLPGTPATRGFVWSWRLVWALLTRRRVEPPRSPVGRAVFQELSVAMRDALGAEDARTLAAMLRRTTIAPPDGRACPILVVRGTRDALLSHAAAHDFAASLSGTLEEIDGGGHWLMLDAQWTRCVERMHRWLVQRLGEPLLELHAEAMAERDEE